MNVRERIARLIAPWLVPFDDQTGDPWPDCICNDHRYEYGHMQGCPRYGQTPDRVRA